MQLDCLAALILWHPDKNQVLLLKRAPFKKIFPNLITGIGGKLELEKGEAEDLSIGLLREVAEETKIDPSMFSDVHLRLSTMIVREDVQFLLLWFTGMLNNVPADLSCNEGELQFYPIDQLPLAECTPTAREVLPFILKLDDDKVYNGVFKDDGTLLVNE